MDPIRLAPNDNSTHQHLPSIVNACPTGQHERRLPGGNVKQGGNSGKKNKNKPAIDKATAQQRAEANRRSQAIADRVTLVVTATGRRRWDGR